MGRYRLLISLVAILLLVLWGYWPMWNSFFVLDELGALGNYTVYPNWEWGEIVGMALRPMKSHYVPLHRALVPVYVRYFGLEYWNYVAASLVAHLLVVVLVFWVLLRIMKNRWMAVLGAGLFGVSAGWYQATSWVFADVNTHGATLLVLLAWLALPNIWFSFGFLVLSLLIKEIGVAMFLLLPMWYWVFIKKNWRVWWVFGIGGMLYAGLRMMMVGLPSLDEQDLLVTQTQSLGEVVYNMATFPIKIFGQGMISVKWLLEVLKSMGPPTTKYAIFVEGILLLAIEMVIFGLVVWLVYKVYQRNKKQGKLVIFGLVFLVLNSLVYALSPARGGRVPVVDSRNLYLPGVGFVVMMVGLISAFKKVWWRYLMMAGLMLINLIWLRGELGVVVDRGRVRRDIVKQIIADHPQVPDRVVFLTESDRSFFGFPDEDKIMPFEVNFGYNLLVFYIPSKLYAREMVEESLFWDGILEQGYMEQDGKGFGYYRDFELMKEELARYGLGPDSVIAYRYVSSKNELVEITEEIRGEL